MITTVSDDQTLILQNIQTLHNQGDPFQADVTFSTGHFWRKMGYVPEIRCDLDPDLKDLTHPGVDVRALSRHFKPKTLQSVVFDPPFIHAPGKDSIMGNRFSGYPSQRALREMYAGAALEFEKVIRPQGLLVWKCQDIVESGKQVWNHIWIVNRLAGTFDLVDLFVLTAKSRIQGHNHARQVHARKTHSYVLVFRRGK